MPVEEVSSQITQSLINHVDRDYSEAEWGNLSQDYPEKSYLFHSETRLELYFNLCGDFSQQARRAFYNAEVGVTTLSPWL